MPDTKTKRVLDITSKVEARSAPDGKRFIEGLIPYDSRSEIIWDFVEVIAPGAFNKTLADGAEIKAFWAHDDAAILGSRKAGTLKLENRAEGLAFSVELRDTEVAKDYFETVARGDCNGVSFGFIAERTEWDETVAPAVRTLKEVRLLEISPGVAFPAYPGAQSAAAMRSIFAEAPLLKEQRSKPAALAAPASPEPAPAPPSPAPEGEARAEAEDEEERQRARARLALARASDVLA